MVLTPLASLGHYAGESQLENGEHPECLDTMQACKSTCCPSTPKQQTCCDGNLGNVLHRIAQGESEPDPASCGDQGDCSCCTTISCSVVLGINLQSDRSLTDNVIHLVSAVVHTPAYPGWHHPLLRPPIF